MSSGSIRDADAVTRSTGIGVALPGSAAFNASTRPFTASSSAGFVGPWLEPPEAVALPGIGDVVEGRPQKYFGDLQVRPITAEPTTFPPIVIKLPAAWPSHRALAIPVTQG